MKPGETECVGHPNAEGDVEGPPFSEVTNQRPVGSGPETRPRQAPAAAGMGSLLLGESPKMAEVRDLIQRIADTDVTVLVRGESGTGKELVARTVCASSLRRDKPFVKVNCAALPAELLESELFGFERGAFTGAIQQKPGKFEFANHGTMFLDEVGEMSVALQAKLLQVLQDGEFSRLGGKRDVRVDVRIIAATNRDLERSLGTGQFREDLFFRLNVVSIQLPPLRARREELPALTDYFMKKYSVQYNRTCRDISAETMSLFMQYDWPGNVRELENVIKRAVVLGGDAGIRKDVIKGIELSTQRVGQPPRPSNRVATQHNARPASALLPATPTQIASAAHQAGNYSLKQVARTAARQAERELISRVLQQTRWNRKEAAEILSISYKALLYKIKDSGLDRAS